MNNKMSDYEMALLFEEFAFLFEENNIDKDSPADQYDRFQRPESRHSLIPPRKKGIAQKIADSLKQKDLTDFYERMISLMESSNNRETLKQILVFINYVLNNQRYIPGNSAAKLSKMILKENKLSEIIVEKFKTVQNINIKRYIINEYLKIESLMSQEQRELIEEHIFSNDYFLVQDLLYIHQDNFEKCIERIVNSKNIYTNWMLLEHFISMGTTDIQPYIENIKKINHPIINEKIEQYEEVIDLIEEMDKENRFEYTDDELEEIENFPFSYMEFIDKITDYSKEIFLTESEIEKELELMINSYNE